MHLRAIEAASADRSGSEFQKPGSIENDFSAGYTGAAGAFNHTVGGT